MQSGFPSPCGLEPAAFDDAMLGLCAAAVLPCERVHFGAADSDNFRGDFRAFRAMGAVKVRHVVPRWGQSRCVLGRGRCCTAWHHDMWHCDGRAGAWQVLHCVALRYTVCMWYCGSRCGSRPGGRRSLCVGAGGLGCSEGRASVHFVTAWLRRGLLGESWALLRSLGTCSPAGPLPPALPIGWLVAGRLCEAAAGCAPHPETGGGERHRHGVAARALGLL